MANLVELSREGLQYAQALGIRDKTKLAARIYFFNRIPVAPAMLREQWIDTHFFPDPSHREACGMLLNHWDLVVQEFFSESWQSWRRKGNAREFSSDKVKYKLYVSPSLTAVNEVLDATIKVFTQQKVRVFKVAKDVAGICRPDKIVAYFKTQEELHSTASALWEQIRNHEAHGVPFSAPLFDTGILSWGVDPPRRYYAGHNLEMGSWRVWLSFQMAEFMLSCPEDFQQRPWEYVLSQIAARGINTKTWEPSNIKFQHV